MTTLTVLEQAFASHLDATPVGVRVVPRDETPWWRGRRAGRWRPLDPERVFETLCTLPRTGLVLVRPAAADPGAMLLAAAGAVLGLDVITLPGDLDEAIWCVGVALALGIDEPETFGRVLDVVCCGPVGAPAFPRQLWGPAGISVPALRPATLARWASCAWRPCSWCQAGGLPGHRCRRCGAPVVETAAEVAA
jgi:hypothetical protein